LDCKFEMFFSGYVKSLFGNGISAWRGSNESIDEKGYFYALISSILYSLDTLIFGFSSQNEIHS